MRSLIGLTLGFCALYASGAVVRVDTGVGVQGALDKVRSLRKSGSIDPQDGVTVLFAPGDYRVPETVWLRKEDGGPQASAPVVWRPERSGTVRFTPGVRIPIAAFRPVADRAVLDRLPAGSRDKVLEADVSSVFPRTVPVAPDLYEGASPAPYLFLNGEMLKEARWPNEGYASFPNTNVVDHGGTERRGPYRPGAAFVLSEARARRWNVAEGVWLNGFWTHEWYSCAARVASFGAENGTNDILRLRPAVKYGVGNKAWGQLPYRRFVATGILEELDAPGEWYVKRDTKRLYLMPPADGLKAEDEVVITPNGATLLANDVRREPLANFRLEGIRFECLGGSAFRLGGRNIVVRDCDFRACGGEPVGQLEDAWNSAVSGCRFSKCAGRVLAVSGGDFAKLVRAETVVENCLFEDFGLVRKAGATAIAFNGCGLTVRGNVIRRAPHNVIVFGAADSVIEDNEISDVVRETSDAGAIYSGRNWQMQGNVIRNNYFHDFAGGAASPGGTSAVYLDDCVCGIAVEGNVFRNIHIGVKIGGGRENPVRHNLFVDCRTGISIDFRGKAWGGWTTHDPSNGWNLVDKCEALKYREGIWAKRYPQLADHMNDEPAAPFNDPLEHNVFLDCASPIGSWVEKRQSVGPWVESIKHRLYAHDNLVLWSAGRPEPDVSGLFASSLRVVTEADAGGDFGFADRANHDYTLKPGAYVLRHMPGFRPYQFDRMRRERRLLR